MDIRFLSSLLEVVDTGSIAAAARNQMLTSAAVSQRIKALEQSLGCPLLNRSGHSAKPTEACLRLLPRLKHLVAETQALQNDLDQTGLSGDLKVGAVSTALTGIMPTVIQQLASHLPDLNLQISPGTSANLYQQLLDKNLDVIIIVKPPFVCPKYLQTSTLYTEQLGFISSDTNTLSMKESLLNLPYIQYDRSAWGGAIADSYLLDRDIAVNTLCELDALESIVLMVKRNMGVSLVPIWQGLEEVAHNIKIQPISGKQYQRHIQLITHRQVGKERLIEAFSDTVMKASKELMED